jgi:uncharacterized protein YjbI with pentapeptide repeats
MVMPKVIWIVLLATLAIPDGTTLAAQDCQGIQAEDLIAMIHANQSVELDGVVICGDLDLTTAGEADAQGIIHITAPLRLTNSQFTGRVSAYDRDIPPLSVSFDQPVNLRGSTFKNLALFPLTHFNDSNFTDATFENAAEFTHAVFANDAAFDGADFRGEGEFLGVEFGGAAGFSNAHFRQDANFYGSHFSSSAFFHSADFHARADFLEAHFDREADFTEARYGGPTVYDSSVFGEQAAFSSASFGGAATFEQSQFVSGANFREAEFLLGAAFGGATFGSDVTFEWARFSGVTEFSGVKFVGGANFWHAIYDGESVSFHRTEFTGDALFPSVIFSSSAYFSSVQFRGASQFAGSQFGDYATFTNSVFTGTANFENAAFSHAANFENTLFQNDARFSNAIFGGDALFEQASFAMVNFTDASFSGTLDLGEANFSQLTVDTLEIQLPPSSRIKVLKGLERNFRVNDELELANEAYYRRSVAMREGKSLPEQIIEFVLEDLLFGYGVRPWNTVIVSAIVILIFAVFYYPKGVVVDAPVGRPKREWKLTMRLTELPVAQEGEFGKDDQQPHDTRNQKKDLTRTQMAWRALSFSFGVFTKYSAGSLLADRHKKIVILEWFLGLLMLAGFAYTLSNTSPALKSIFGGFLP